MDEYNEAALDALLVPSQDEKGVPVMFIRNELHLIPVNGKVFVEIKPTYLHYIEFRSSFPSISSKLPGCNFCYILHLLGQFTKQKVKHCKGRSWIFVQDFVLLYSYAQLFLEEINLLIYSCCMNKVTLLARPQKVTNFQIQWPIPS